MPEAMHDSATSEPKKDIVLLIHGIRDFALWNESISATLEDAGFIPGPITFGRFDLLRFLAPVPWFRAWAVKTVQRQIDQYRTTYKGHNISVIAHSFGTWVIAKILQEDLTLQLHRVIFCGSVVHPREPLENFTTHFAHPILNDIGEKDPWPALAESTTWGYGSAGTYGFRRPPFKDRWHKKNGNHRFFLKRKFCLKYWIPFLKNGSIIKTDTDSAPPKLWVRLISVIRLKYVAILVLVCISWITGHYDVYLTPRERERQDLELAHSLENPEHTLVVPPSTPRPDPIVIKSYHNADVAIEFRHYKEWVPLSRRVGRTASVNPDIDVFALWHILAREAHAQAVETIFPKSTVKPRSISVISSCRFLCPKQNNYSFQIYADGRVSATELTRRGETVSDKPATQMTLSEVFSIVRLSDFSSGSTLDRASVQNKIAAFWRTAGVSDPERVIAFIDATLFGSGSKGVAFTESNFCANSGALRTPFCISYAELRTTTITGGWTSWLLNIGDQEVSLAGSDVDASQLHALIEIARTLQ